MERQTFFSEKLLLWDETQNTRQMPWKGEKDPYRIWISEIILQQTRVQQGLAYYNRFIEALPDVISLASASEEKVYKLWEGLGYYSRCRHLMEAARFIRQELDGKFPQTHESILALKGVGNYTAAAIGSFAFNLPLAVLDGNVFRVLARFFGKDVPINTEEGKKFFAGLAIALLDKKQPGRYNQAVMDFGAVICKPAAPLCRECPLKARCVAYSDNRVTELPVNTKNIRIRTRHFNYLIIEYDNRYYVRKRTGKDIWQNLYEFPLVETPLLPGKSAPLFMEEVAVLLKNALFEVKSVSEPRTQKLTHQLIKGQFFHLQIHSPLTDESLVLADAQQLLLLPFPKFIASYLAEKNVSLSSIRSA